MDVQLTSSSDEHKRRGRCVLLLLLSVVIFLRILRTQLPRGEI